MAGCDPEVQGIRLLQGDCKVRTETFFFFFVRANATRETSWGGSESAAQMKDRPSFRAKYRSCFDHKVL